MTTTCNIPKELMAALTKYENRLGNSWVADCQEHISDKRLRETWQRSDEGRSEFLSLLEKYIREHEFAQKEVESLKSSLTCTMQTLTDAAMLIQKLCRRHPWDAATVGALDWLKRKNLQGSPLRDE